MSESFSITVNGKPVPVFEGTSVAAAIEKLRAEVAAKVVRQVAGRSPMAALAEQGGPAAEQAEDHAY